VVTKGIKDGVLYAMKRGMEPIWKRVVQFKGAKNEMLGDGAEEERRAS